MFKEPYRNKVLNLWREMQLKDYKTKMMLYKLMSEEEKLDYNLIHDEIYLKLDPNHKCWIINESNVKEIKR